MKMKQVYIEFEKKIEVTLWAPESMAEDQIREIANDVAADGLRDWDDPEWEVYVGQIRVEEVADETLKLGPPNKYGYRKCLAKELTTGLVVNDEENDMVQPEDATWWVNGTVEAE